MPDHDVSNELPKLKLESDSKKILYIYTYTRFFFEFQSKKCKDWNRYCAIVITFFEESVVHGKVFLFPARTPTYYTI